MARHLALGFLAVLFLASFCYAQQEEITFTTYYPSPYGSYNELHVSQLAIGSAFQNTTAANIPQDGLLVQGAIALGSGVCNKEGLIQYSTGNHRLEYCDGANWKPVGGAPRITNFFGPGNLGYHDICALSRFSIEEDGYTNCWTGATLSRNTTDGTWSLNENNGCGSPYGRDSITSRVICIDW